MGWLRGDSIDVDAAVRELTGHHRRGAEVGEVSDGEVALAIDLLTHDGQVERAVSLLKAYVLDYRRARQPLDYEISARPRLEAK